METVTVAGVQATPEFLDRDATVQKVVRLTKEAAGLGARLIVFPETFIPPIRTGCGAPRRGTARSRR
jgi:nitrilase